jgi:predicted MFS family arabinose efflux permease
MDLRENEPTPPDGLRADSAATLNSQVVLFTGARTILNTSYRMIYPFLSVFARGLGLDLADLSMVMTGRSLMGLLGPLLAPIADRRGRKISMLLGLGLMVFANALIWLFPIFPVFIVCVLLAALSNLIFTPAMQAYIGDRVPYNRRGRILGITELSWAIAFIAGIPFIGWLMEQSEAQHAWRVPFPWLAGLGLLFWIAIAWRVPNNRSAHASPANGWHALKQVLVVPSVLAGLGFAICASAANEVVNLIFGVWLEDQFALKLAALGAASAVIGISELSGEGLSALFTDRLGKERAVKLGLIMSVCATVVLYFFSGSVTGALIGLFLFYLGFEFTVVSSLPLMSEVFPAARATVMAAAIACFSLGRAMGDLITPWLYQVDFLANLICSLGFNVLAFFLLNRVHIGTHEPKSV